MYIINSNVTTPKRVLAFDASPHTWFNGDCKEISQLKASYLIGSILAGSQLEPTPSILFYRSLLFSCHRLRDPYLRPVYQQMFCAGRLHSPHCENTMNGCSVTDRSLRSLMTVDIAGRSL